MKSFNNKIALITGGAAGIGKLMGQSLLQLGIDTLIIWDINETNLNNTKNEFIQLGYKVDAFKVDVSSTQQIIDNAKLVIEKYNSVDILINNAGIVVGKFFLEHTHQEMDKTMQVNTNALMHITKEFLPGMLLKNQGHIINIASAAGMVSNPKLSVYVASKFAVIGWSDSLRIELENEKSAIKVTTVTPFYISTGMFDGVKSDFIPMVTPEKAVQKIIDGIQRNKKYVRMPGIVYWVPFVKGLLPEAWFTIVVGKWLGMHRTMNEFKGRN